jgi:hypothetical protein
LHYNLIGNIININLKRNTTKHNGNACGVPIVPIGIACGDKVEIFWQWQTIHGPIAQHLCEQPHAVASVDLVPKYRPALPRSVFVWKPVPFV